MYCSILISNYNKEKYLKECLSSCINQDYIDFEILIGDNGSQDKSIEIINSFENIKLFNIERKFPTAELNQINIIKNLFQSSKGEIILLLDSDDCFEINKLKKISKIFDEDKSKECLCDLPQIINDSKTAKKFSYTNNTNFKERWPTIFPTSTISIRRDSFSNFINEEFEKEYSELAIDFRLVSYFFNFKQNLSITDQMLTRYLSNNEGNENNYKKYTPRWWKRRNQSFDFLIEILKKKNIDHDKTLDYRVTRFLNKIF